MSGEGGAPAGAVRQMENHEAYNILDDLQKDQKIDADGAEEAK